MDYLLVHIYTYTVFNHIAGYHILYAYIGLVTYISHTLSYNHVTHIFHMHLYHNTIYTSFIYILNIYIPYTVIFIIPFYEHFHYILLFTCILLSLYIRIYLSYRYTNHLPFITSFIYISHLS